MNVPKFLVNVCSVMLIFATSTLAEETKVLQFKSAAKGRAAGHEHLVVLASLPHGKTVKLIVPNTDPAANYDPVADQAALAQGLKPGDLIQASWDTANDVNTLSGLARYAPRPGELSPNGYVFVSSKPPSDGAGNLVVVLDKLGETTEMGVATVKDSNGVAMPDPDVQVVVDGLKAGDSVWADVTPGKTAVLQAILPWAEPLRGKLVKLVSEDVDGRKQLAAAIESDGKIASAVIPETLKDGKWLPQARLLAAAQRCRAGDTVFYRVQQDSTAIWLREIQPDLSQRVARRGGGNGGGNNSADSGNTDSNGLPRPRIPGGGVPGVGGIPGGF